MDTGTSRPPSDLARAPARQPTTKPRRRVGRWVLLLLVLMIAVLGVLAAIGIGPALEARRALEEGRGDLREARALLLNGEIEEARRAFSEAEGRFGIAVERTRSFPLRAASWVPLLGRSPRVVTAIADAGSGVASAGSIVTDTILSLPRGAASLAPRDGRIQSGPIMRLAPAVDRAAGLVTESRREVEESPDSLLLAGVAPARQEALEELVDLESTLVAAGGLLHELPGFLGADGPVRYMVAAQNPAELRGTGGLMGAYSILTLREGRFEFQSFRPIHDLPTFSPNELEPPSDEYARNWNQFGGAGQWVNINMTPDFPSAAEAIRTAYRKATGTELDGVIAADPVALESLLRVTGPVDVPEVGEVDADSVVPFVANEAYAEFTLPRERKLLLGRVALTVFEEFLRGSEDGVTWIRTIAEAVGDGRVLVNSADPELQAAFDLAGASGAFGPRGEPGDFLALIQNNGGGNKMDYYLDRDIRYTVRLGASGTTVADVRVTLTNTGPDRGMPPYVIGPYPGVADAGENVSLVDLYCRSSCGLLEATRDGEPVDVTGGTEVGARFFRDHMEIPSGERRTFRLRLALPEAWMSEGDGGTYRLTFLDQPTIRPTQLTVRVVPPDGATLVPGSEAISGSEETVTVTEDRLTWSGDPGRRLKLEVGLKL